MVIFYSKISEFKHQNLINNYLKKFDSNYQKKILRYKNWQDFQLSLIGRILLIEFFKENNIPEDEINKIKYTSYGKPFLSNKSFYFNISHSKEIVVCAFSKKYDLGIDIEFLDNVNINDFKSQMLDSEWKRIYTSENKLIEFYKYWTEKESVIKSCGKGLSIPLKSFEVVDNKTTLGIEKYRVYTIDLVDNYHCSIALKSKLKNIEVNEISIREIYY